MNKFQKKINKAKIIFNIKEDNRILDRRIINVLNKLVNTKEGGDLILEMIYDLFHTLELFKNDYADLTHFKLYKIFKLCLHAIDELYFFEKTIGTTKEYNPNKIRDLINKAKPYILNFDDKKIRIPNNPNDTYNEIFYTLADDYKINHNDIVNLLSSIYQGKLKKARVSTHRIKEYTEQKKEYLEIIDGVTLDENGKPKEFTKEEIQNKKNIINKAFKNYL